MRLPSRLTKRMVGAITSTGLGVAAGLLQWGGYAGAGLATFGLILAALALRAAPRPEPIIADTDTEKTSP